LSNGIAVMLSPPIDRLIEALSKPPASFTWSHDHNRLIGTRAGFAVDIWPDKVVCLSIMAFDRPKLAQNNAILLLLVLTALRPDWNAAGDWLAVQMRQAKRVQGSYAGPNGEQSIVFEYHAKGAQALLTIKRLDRIPDRGIYSD
jgi:hypothetical protein